MTPDVNVLVAASRTDHPLHSPALEWLNEAMGVAEGGGSIEVLPMVGAGVLRIVTHAKVFASPTPIEDACAFLRAILDSPGVEMLAMGAEWRAFETLCVSRALAGNKVPDAWIATTVAARGLHLVTFDRGFKSLLESSQFTLLSA